VAAGLLIAGVVLSRAVADAYAGAVLAALAMPYAAAGGLVAFAGDESLGSLGAPHVLVAAAALTTVAVLGYLGVVAAGRIFVAGITVGGYGTLAGALDLAWLAAVEAAAVTAGAVVLLLPAMPLLAVRLGKMPLPALPRTPEDLVRDEPQPSRAAIYRATARADELLTGILFGSAVVAVVCAGALIWWAGVASLLLTGVVGGALLLRARLLTTVRHRVPLLAAGLLALFMLALAVGAALPDATYPVVPLAGVLLAAAVAVAAGLTYSRRPPSPRLGRLGDVFDVTFQLAVVPIVCSVLGLYGFMRALNG
jgi:type VII secretion integral membrane protein EccD